MATAHSARYRITPGRREDALEAIRATIGLWTRLGASASVRQTNVGGEASATAALLAVFPTSSERAEFIDAITSPEHSPNNAVVHAAREANPPLTLLGRSWLNEEPPGEAVPGHPKVLLGSRYRIAPGRYADAEAAFQEWKRIRDDLGIEAHRWTSLASGQDFGVRVLGMHASSWAELDTHNSRIAAYNAERKRPAPMLLAVQSGALIAVGQSISTLVVL